MRASVVVLVVSVACAAALAALVGAGCGGSGGGVAAPPPAILVPPLHDAQQGEELRMRRGDEEWLYRVVAATDDDVTVDFLVYRNGEPVEGLTDKLQWTRNSFGLPEGYVIREFRRDRIEVGGRAHDCWRLKAHARSEIRYYWITDALPVGGFLRVALDDRGRPLVQTAADAILDGR